MLEEEATRDRAEGDGDTRPTRKVRVTIDGTETEIDHGIVAIASITSCTNTSNPSVMMAAGLLARNAVARGLRSKPWVKTSTGGGTIVRTVRWFEDKDLAARISPVLEQITEGQR